MLDHVEVELDKINALPFQGEQSCMVQIDMKKWAQKKGLWPSASYRQIIDAHAKARGWTQPSDSGMEVL
jgi:hypothetical protein